MPSASTLTVTRPSKACILRKLMRYVPISGVPAGDLDRVVAAGLEVKGAASDLPDG